MSIKIAILAATGASLIAACAYAQKTPNAHVDMPIAAQTGKAVEETKVPPPSAATGVAANATASELTNFNKPESPYVADHVSGPTAAAGTQPSAGAGPVPDTAENRALYTPLSTAGRKSRAAGN